MLTSMATIHYSLIHAGHGVEFPLRYLIVINKSITYVIPNEIVQDDGEDFLSSVLPRQLKTGFLICTALLNLSLVRNEDKDNTKKYFLCI